MRSEREKNGSGGPECLPISQDTNLLLVSFHLSSRQPFDLGCFAML